MHEASLRGWLFDGPTCGSTSATHRPSSEFEALGLLDYLILPHYKSDHPESAVIDPASSVPKRYGVGQGSTSQAQATLRHSCRVEILMRRLWSDISVHRASAAVFAVWWFAVHLYMFATGSDGIPVHVVWLHIFTAIAAGALVAWWMYPVREGLLSGWRPAEAPLAGSLVAVAVVTVVFARDGLKAVLAGTGDMTGLVELLFSWLVASVIIGAIGLLCGLMGAGLGSVLAKYLKQLA